MFIFILDETLIAIICVCIVSLGMVGCGGAIVRAICNIQKESESLKRCKSFIINIKENRESDGFKAFMARYTYAGYQRENISSRSIQQLVHKDGPLNTSYVSERLMAIISAVNDKNHIRKTPSLSDLHELTLQREQGGKSVGVFRAITPSILVMGILGTLVGVHDKLDELDLNHLSVLSTALWPGILAVFTTIIMIVFRGWYNKLWSQFISELDDLTLKEILPFFQQPEVFSLDIERFTKAASSVMEGENRLDSQQMVEQIRELNSLISEWHKLYQEVGSPMLEEDLPRAIKGIKDLINCRALMQERCEDVRNGMQDLLKLCSDYSQKTLEGVDKADALLETLPDECSRLMEQLQRDLPLIRNMHDILSLNENKFKNSGFQESVKELKPDGERCAELVQWLSALPQRLQADYGKLHPTLCKHLQNICSHKGNIDELIQTCLTNLPAYFQEALDIHNPQYKNAKAHVHTCKNITHDILSWMLNRSYKHAVDVQSVPLYPPGLFGIKMRLFDLVGNWRTFLYKTWKGRIILLLIILLDLAYMCM